MYISATEKSRVFNCSRQSGKKLPQFVKTLIQPLDVIIFLKPNNTVVTVLEDTHSIIRYICKHRLPQISRLIAQKDPALPYNHRVGFCIKQGWTPISTLSKKIRFLKKIPSFRTVLCWPWCRETIKTRPRNSVISPSTTYWTQQGEAAAAVAKNLKGVRMTPKRNHILGWIVPDFAHPNFQVS